MRKNRGEVRRRAYVESDKNFVRSRTIAGYEPSNSSKEVELERRKEQRKINKQKRRRISLVVLLSVAGIVILLLSQTVFIITGIEYNDSTISRGQDESYLNVVNQYLLEHPSERFGFSRNNELLTDYIEKSYPEVESAKIRGGFGSGRVYLEIRQPVAVWKTNNGSNFVDKNGAIFSNNYYKDPNITINDLSGSGTISQRFLQFIGKIIAGVDSSGVGQVEKVVIPLGAIRYVEITVSGHNYPVKIQTDRDTDSQISDIVAMLKYLEKNDIKPSYADVRVKNRGYWK